jgi:TRAP-type uncharacterized transport system fused permease subunit
MLDFKPFKRWGDCRKLSIEHNDLVAARVVFLKAMHKIKQSISDTLIIVINLILLYNFPRQYHIHTD